MGRRVVTFLLFLAALSGAGTSQAQGSRTTRYLLEIFLAREGGAAERLLAQRAFAAESRARTRGLAREGELLGLDGLGGAGLSRRERILAELGGRLTPDDAIARQLEEAHAWLRQGQNRGTTYVDVINGRLLVSTDGLEFSRATVDFTDISRSRGGYALSPRVVHSEEFPAIEAALAERRAKVVLLWEHGGRARTAQCTWTNAAQPALLLEVRPFAFARVDSNRARAIIPLSSPKLPRNRESHFVGGLPSTPWSFDELRWINLQTEGSVAPIAKQIPASQTISPGLRAGDQRGNLARFADAVRQARGKDLLLTAHREGRYFVSRIGGEEIFRIEVDEAVRIAANAGVDVFLVGCSTADVARSGMLVSVNPRQVAAGVERARTATTRDEFLYRFASKETPLVLPDAAPAPKRAPVGGHEPLPDGPTIERGQLVALAGLTTFLAPLPLVDEHVPPPVTNAGGSGAPPAPAGPGKTGPGSAPFPRPDPGGSILPALVAAVSAALIALGFWRHSRK